MNKFMRLRTIFSLLLPLVLLNACSVAVTPGPTTPPAASPTATAAANSPTAGSPLLTGTLVYVEDSQLHRFDLSTGSDSIIDGAQKFLAAEGTGAYVSLSPNHRYLAFSGLDPQYGCSTFHPEQPCTLTGPSGFFLVDSQTSLVTLIAPYALDELSWAPAGAQLVFASPDFLEVPYRTSLKISSPQGSEPFLLTSGEHVDTHPAWSPTGRWIAFLREPSPAPDQPECITASPAYNTCVDPALYIIQPDGSELRVILDHVRVLNSAYNAPAWSPDGKNLVVVSGENASALSLVEIASGKLTVVDTGAPVTEIAGWSADGSMLLFSRGEKGSQQVLFLDTNTLAQTVISRNNSDDAHPVWSPDGKAVAYLTRDALGNRALVIHSLLDPGQPDQVIKQITPLMRFLWVE